MAQADGRPNILIICTDQQNWRMNSVNGHPLVRTPNLERLAARGVNFRACYSNSPVCAPARASLFTGLYPREVGAYDNAAPLDGRSRTFGHVARERGYYATATGKLDFCRGVDYGFVEVETKHGHDTSPDITAFFRNPIAVRPADLTRPRNVVRQGPPSDRRFLDVTADFIRCQASGLGRPWLAWTGWGKPHDPYVTSAEMLATYPLDRIDLPAFPDDWRATEHPVMTLSRYQRCCLHDIPAERARLDRAAYYGMITELDGMVGELLDALEQSGQADDTVVIFTSDHGDMMGEHGFFWKNAPFDDCARVPLIMAGPGLQAGRTVETPVSLLDLHATILELIGAAPSASRGRSLLPVARGEGAGPPFVYMELNTERLITGVFTIVQGPWKYNYYAGYQDEMFNLAEDLGEWRNRVRDAACADARERLRRLLFCTVDPDRVNEQAFADQERRFDAHIGPGDASQVLANERVFKEYASRLGAEQARDLIALRCRRRAARSG